MAKAKKPKNERPENYEPKLAIKGTLKDVLKVAVGKKPSDNPPPPETKP